MKRSLIATQLGVATWTISKDLKEFSPEVKTSRPKGGRPKGKIGASYQRRSRLSRLSV
jgi:hypothetical protein